jgi:hypothetical protein
VSSQRGSEAASGGATPIELIGGFESTLLPAHDRDIFETTEHDVRWRDDLALLEDDGVRRLRYPIRWHRIEKEEGLFDWSDTDTVMEYLREQGFHPIVDLIHHTSYPLWLDGGFGDPRFGTAYLRYAREFALRYPWVEEYTLFNEPFSTLFLAGHEAIWPPYASGLKGFIDLVANVLPAVAAASTMYRDLLPNARHVWVDTCEHHTGLASLARRWMKSVATVCSQSPAEVSMSWGSTITRTANGIFRTRVGRRRRPRRCRSPI